jgi:uncharacterized protein with PIN domain
MLQAYAQRFADRLRKLQARRVDAGVEQLIARARRQRATGRSRLFPALHQIDLHLQKALLDYQARRDDLVPSPDREPPTFLCDSGLGGLARWLRAAGYQADWRTDYDDTEAVDLAERRGSILLTTDGPLMDRRSIQQQQVRAFWIAPALSIQDQLDLVRREFFLALRAPRCMNCGGALREVDPHTVWERIPPRTRLWLNQYFECRACDQLFWHGTHWRQIRQRLNE